MRSFQSALVHFLRYLKATHSLIQESAVHPSKKDKSLIQLV